MQNLLEWSVRALAQNAETQLALFPDFVCVGDELAMNFGDGLPELDRMQDVSDEQRAAVEALDALLVAMSGPSQIQFWCDRDSIRSHPVWEEIRILARAAVDAFDWDRGAPPPSGDIYISAGM